MVLLNYETKNFEEKINSTTKFLYILLALFFLSYHYYSSTEKNFSFYHNASFQLFYAFSLIYIFSDELKIDVFNLYNSL